MEIDCAWGTIDVSGSHLAILMLQSLWQCVAVCVAVCCSVRCSVLQCALQCVAVCVGVLYMFPDLISLFRSQAMRVSRVHHVAVCVAVWCSSCQGCSMLQHVATCCSMLQHVAACCSVSCHYTCPHELRGDGLRTGHRRSLLLHLGDAAGTCHTADEQPHTPHGVRLRVSRSYALR